MDSELDGVLHYGFCIDDLYHSWRTHLSVGKDAPQFRGTQAWAEGKMVETREVGDLDHDYERQAA
jgi:hypothetical protein